MPTEAESSAVVIDQLSELLLHWQELRRQGRQATAEELCAGQPEIVEELRRQMHAVQAMEALLGMGACDTPPTTDPDPVAGPSRSSQPADSHAGPARDRLHLPGYEILGILDQGGMGIVYKARQLQLNRLVAIKMILAGPHARLEQLTRFRVEAEAVAQLRHPNIVQIYEVGEWRAADTESPLPYFSMEFVEGGSLAETLAKSPLPARQAAQLVETLARAIHTAHEHGIIHRDLKPGNILLQKVATSQQSGASNESRDAVVGAQSRHMRSTDDRQLTTDYSPKITDFGLAKRLDTDSGQTQTGAVMGTPSYIAPEQAEGKNRHIGPAVDIYALGAILYEGLTGRPPFQGESTLDTLEQVRRCEPVPPARLQPKVPRDLETICLKCLEKEPAKRYPSALALADDLRRFLDGVPILARPLSLWGQAIKWAKRKPALAGVSAVCLAAVVSLLVMWTRFTAELQVERDHARKEKARAEKQEQIANTGWEVARQREREAQRERDIAREQRKSAQAVLYRCVSLVERHAEATVQGKTAARVEGTPYAVLYEVARVYALTSGTYRKDTELPEPARDQLAEELAKEGVKLLERAWSFGYFATPSHLDKLKHDKDLDALRSRADFKDLLERTAKARK